LKLWCEYGLRETPTTLYPNEKGSATLTTTKHQEVFNYLRPWYPEENLHVTPRDMTLLPAADSSRADIPAFLYRPEVKATFIRLRNLRPGCLYIFGGKSEMSAPELQKEKLDVTGVDAGGSGGVAAGRVKGVSLEGIGHLVAMQVPQACADNAAKWIGQELDVWRKQQRQFEAWSKKTLLEKQTISEELKNRLRGPRQKSIPKEKL